MKALCLIRSAPCYRSDAFRHGLKLAGYELADRIDRPASDDVLVEWNRYGPFDEQARRFESAGARVVVVENGYLGKGWLGGNWYAMALGHHGGAGTWVDGGPQRWDALGVDLAPWRTGGKEVLILGQRGIGEPGIASPDHWAETTQRRIGGRIRPHPDVRGVKPVPLEDDLRDVACVVTWASSAALRALMLGIPVWYGMERWIGAAACRHLSGFGREPLRDDAARLAMFQRLIWAQWRIEEVQDGSAFRHLLCT